MSEEEIRKDERFKVLDRISQLVGIFIDGPLRDSVYAILDSVKTEKL